MPQPVSANPSIKEQAEMIGLLGLSEDGYKYHNGDAKLSAYLGKYPAAINMNIPKGAYGKIYTNRRADRTLFLLASANRNREALKLLAAKGADVTAKDANGYNGLHAASTSYPDRVVEAIGVLMDLGVPVTKNAFGQFPQDMLRENGYMGAVDVIARKLAEKSGEELPRDGNKAGPIRQTKPGTANG